MLDDAETHTERLFSAEADLREAATAFAVKSNRETRRVLREAAILYAETSQEVDEAVEALRDGRVTPDE